MDGPELEAAYIGQQYMMAATSYAATGFMPSLESMNSAPAALSSSGLCSQFSMGLTGEDGSHGLAAALQPQGSVSNAATQPLHPSACMSTAKCPAIIHNFSLGSLGSKPGALQHLSAGVCQ